MKLAFGGGSCDCRPPDEGAGGGVVRASSPRRGGGLVDLFGIIWENKQSIWKIESHLERLPKGQKALEWLKGLKLGWVVEVGDGQGGWVIREP